MNRAALEREETIERAGIEAEEAPLDPPASQRLSELEPPLLVVTGELDVASVNAASAWLAAQVPGAEAVEIAGATHLPSFERPECSRPPSCPSSSATRSRGAPPLRSRHSLA